MVDAVVVGSGPNGLAAAVTLAQAGLSVTVLEAAGEPGGGTRSSELTLPGVLHDHCSAVHPLGVGSPYLSSLPLARYGLRWRWPAVDLAHPLDDGRAGVLVRSLADTAAGLGADGASWRSLFGPLARDLDGLATDVLRPLVHVPRHPVALARFGSRAVLPATTVARRFRGEEARALFAGCAAHQLGPLTRPLSAAVGLTLVAAGHAWGWPVAEGGSRAISDALVGLLRDLGGTVECGVRVRSLADLPPARAVLLDVAPAAAVMLAGDAMPARVARAYRRWRHGPGAFKVDLAVEGGIPWRAAACRRAGTVHVGGTLAEVVRAESDVSRGRMPARPFVLVAQQHLADPGRSAGDVHPVWAYAHVPHGWPGDATEAVLGQLERFAPGVRERVVAVASRSTGQLERDNPNYVGGDIGGGANDGLQLGLRPRLAADPYWTGIPGVYLCSASTPPGAGVHGMCGHHAARAALRRLPVRAG